MPAAIPTQVAALHPTQMTVSGAHVERIRGRLRTAVAQGQLEDFLTWYPISAVRGPGERLYVIGEHATARALADQEVATCLVVVRKDVSDVRAERFWVVMESEGWAFPIDESGRRRGFGAIPHDLRQLKDDPYRTLAVALREAGAYEDVKGIPAEFAWAAFLRSCVPAATLASDFAQALQIALAQAHSPAARRLPGWKQT
jgi:hypothetical protein